MKDPGIIPTNFRVPKDCHHQWILFLGTEAIGVMHGIPGRKQIRQGFREPSDVPFASSKVQSQSLDWITESVMHLRHLCGADE